MFGRTPRNLRIFHNRQSAPRERTRGSRRTGERSHFYFRPRVETLDCITLLSTASAALVADIIPGSVGSNPIDLTNVGNRLFFLASDGLQTYDTLWTSDGTAAGTIELSTNLEPSAPVAIGSIAYFTATDSLTGAVGLYQTNGTVAGTSEAAPLPASATESIAVLNGTIYLQIYDYSTSANELWTSDGTAAGTSLLTTIPQASDFTAAGNNLFFTASDPVHGDELWKTDGTAAGTGLVADINPGAGGSYPTDLTALNGTLYFLATNGTTYNEQLWESDGTAAGTFQIAPNVSPIQLSAADGKLVFTGEDVTSFASGLYTSDGTTAGTALVSALPAGTPMGLVVAGNAAYLGLYAQGAAGFELWGSSLAAGSTPNLLATVQSASNFTASGGRFWFTAQTSTAGEQLWESDGTAAGTLMITDLNPTAGGANAQQLTDVNGTLFFTANDGVHGDELWSASAAQPTVAIAGTPDTTFEGSPIALTGSIGGIASGTYVETWSVTFDGAAYASGTGQSFTFTPEEEGTYDVSTSVEPQPGGTPIVSTSTSIAVSAVTPTLALNGGSVGARGQSIVLNLSASSPSSVDEAAGFAYIISWGDGSPATTLNAGSTLTLNHVYQHTGFYTITATATDDDGMKSSATTTSIAISPVAIEPDPLNPALTDLVTGGSISNSVISFVPGTQAGSVTVLINGVNEGTYDPTGAIFAYGQSNADVIWASDSITLPMLFFGDGVLKGGGGPSALVGGSGTNVLIGGLGPSVLIGGGGSNVLIGRSGDDLMIAASTIYDQNAAAIDAILAEWDQPIPLASRVSNLTQGISTPAGLISLDQASIVVADTFDLIIGGVAPDWFIVDPQNDWIWNAQDEGSLISEIT